MSEPTTRKVSALTNVGNLQAGDVVVGERVSGTTVRFTVDTLEGGGAVDSVNGQTGVVVIDADDIDDTSTTNKFVTSTDLTTLTNTSGVNSGNQTSIVGITGTKSQFDTAVSDGNFLYVGDVTQYTDELAQDAVGTMTGTSLKYDDAGATLQRAALTGDVTASQDSNATTISNDAVTYAKIQNISATDKLLGRSTSGSGDVEEIPCTAAGRAIIDDADAAAQRTTLGLGTLATQSGTFSGTSSGTNTGDQTITLTGDVTGSGIGSFAATIANSAVTLAKQANMATASVVYRKTSGSGAPEVQSLATLKTDLGLTGANSGDQTSLSGISDTKANFDTACSDGNFVYQSGALGTPSSGVLTNCTGTASGLTAGNVTTNANLTGDVTSSGNATTLAVPGSVTVATDDKVSLFDTSASNVHKYVLAQSIADLYKRLTSFYVYRNSAQSIASATQTKILFDTETFDTGSRFDNATNYRFTPTIAGKYIFFAQVSFADTFIVGNLMSANLFKNGSNIAQSSVYAPTTVGALNAQVGAILSMNGSTDYVEVYVYQDNAASRSIFTGSPYTFFCGGLLELT